MHVGNVTGERARSMEWGERISSRAWGTRQVLVCRIGKAGICNLKDEWHNDGSKFEMLVMKES